VLLILYNFVYKNCTYKMEDDNNANEQKHSVETEADQIELM
jgi:hypothetical protein